MARHEGAMTIFLAPINLSHSISLLRERRGRPAGEQYKALLWATTHRPGRLFAEFMFAEKRGRETETPKRWHGSIKSQISFGARQVLLCLERRKSTSCMTHIYTCNKWKWHHARRWWIICATGVDRRRRRALCARSHPVPIELIKVPRAAIYMQICGAQQQHSVFSIIILIAWRMVIQLHCSTHWTKIDYNNKNTSTPLSRRKISPHVHCAPSQK